MIKKNYKFNKKTKFGRDEVVNRDIIRMISKKKKRLKSSGKDWDSTVNLNCRSAEFNDIHGIDFFYRVFHHDMMNKDKLKDIINDINNDINDNDEKIITGDYLVKFTPILYALTQRMIKENKKEYRKFQNENSKLNKKNFKNWWSAAHHSTFSNIGIGKIILDIRKFWAVFFSSFKNVRNFQNFEKRILTGNDKLSKDYTRYVRTLSNYGVPKFIDPQSITSTHHDNNIRVFTNFSVFSELWRLNKPIFCSYRTLFIECSSGIKEMDNCPFNNWENFNFHKLKDPKLEDISEYVGELVIQNAKNSIIGHLDIGEDWKQDEISRMFERDNPTSRARLLENAESAAQQSKHSHGVDSKIAHTHSNNPANNSSEDYIRQQARAETKLIQNWTRQYGLEGLTSNDPSLPSILNGNVERGLRRTAAKQAAAAK